MKTNLHHAHLFASDMDKSINFYREMFGAEILFDLEIAGDRNVMIAIGSSKINFYDQPPKDLMQGVVNHLGIETEDNLFYRILNKNYFLMLRKAPDFIKLQGLR